MVHQPLLYLSQQWIDFLLDRGRLDNRVGSWKLLFLSKKLVMGGQTAGGPAVINCVLFWFVFYIG